MPEGSHCRARLPTRMLILRSNQTDRSAKCVSFYRIVLIEDLWHEEARRSTRLSTKEAERRAWAPVNKSDKGGRKKGGGGRGKKRSTSSSRKGGRQGGRS